MNKEAHREGTELWAEKRTADTWRGGEQGDRREEADPGEAAGQP